jgi:AraC family ethanolamine operon transcriptional activator
VFSPASHSSGYTFPVNYNAGVFGNISFRPMSAGKMTQTNFQAGKFDDCDEWCQMAAGWDLRFQQLDRGALNAEMVRVMTPELVLQKVHVSRRLHQSGCAPEGLLTFGLPVEPHLHRCFGRELAATSVINFGRRGGYESVSEPRFNGQTVSVQAKAFLDECIAIGGPGNAEQIADRDEEFVVSKQHRRQLLKLGSALLQSASGTGFEQRGAPELASDIRYLLALAIVESTPQPATLSSTARQSAVDRALEVIHANDGTLSIPDICRYAAASARTLSRGFRERFGISTKQYMVAIRLSGVRRTLRKGRASVTEAAGQFGFWHLGQFSADYLAMFGELPSETLKSKPRPTM